MGYLSLWIGALLNHNDLAWLDLTWRKWGVPKLKAAWFFHDVGKRPTWLLWGSLEPRYSSAHDLHKTSTQQFYFILSNRLFNEAVSLRLHDCIILFWLTPRIGLSALMLNNSLQLWLFELLGLFKVPPLLNAQSALIEPLTPTEQREHCVL